MSEIQWSDDELFYTYKGVEHCCNEEVLSILLKEEIVFANSRDYAHTFKGNDKFPEVKWPTEPDGHTVVLFVNCNDLFAWGCADSEDIRLSEVGALYKAHKADPKWGTSKWCCKKRNQQPQPPIKRDMKRDGAWDDEMEALPGNTMDAEVQGQLAAMVAP